MKPLLIFLLLMPLEAFTPEAIPNKPDPFTESNFKILVHELCQHPEIVMAQARLESAHFTSKVWKEYNNPFGIRMKKDGVWQYRPFETWQESVIYYANFQQRKYKGGDYFVFLRELPYAMDSSYTSKLIAML